MPMPELSARQVATILFCVISFQLIYHFREPIEETFLHSSSPYSGQSIAGSNSGSGSSYSGRNRHPTVPLSLQELSILDELSEAIVSVEALRVFSGSGLADIHGTSIKGNTENAKRIRDQIHCWTQHGSWVRDDNNIKGASSSSWAARGHLGDPMFSKCDTRFIDGLNKIADEGHGDYFQGEFDREHKRWIVREAVKYRWVPDESICGPISQQPIVGLEDDRSKYLPFNTQDFCKAVGNRNILFAGDVTQFQLHDSILSAVGEPFNCNDELGCLHTDPHQLCPGNPSYLKYARNDVISVPWAVNPEDEEFPDGSTVEQAWATDDMLQQYKILVLNKGLVWRPDDEFLNELVFTMKQLWRYYPDNMIIYRATHPVSNCTILKEQGEDEVIATMDGLSSIVPGTTIQKPLIKAPERTGDRKDSQRVYRPALADIQRQNKMAKAIVEAAGGIFLDTEEMFALRPDGRMGDGDCSRFCAPGPLDVYADLLYNTLRILPRGG
ncbi:hypothetical protein BGX27_001250 [Mortierella sp. AM989]|nr:hypothetical protein BGX27_001250 [Mortierella sp. AM989]